MQMEVQAKPLTIYELLGSLQAEVGQIKSGDMPLDIAAAVAKTRKMQLQGMGQVLAVEKLRIRHSKDAQATGNLKQILGSLEPTTEAEKEAKT